MNIKNYLLLMGLGFFTLTSIAQNTDEDVHTQIVTAVAVPEGQQSSGIQDLVNQYFADGSPIKKNDRKNLALKDSDIAVHLFQLGPKNETAFPEFDIRSGPNCEKRQPLEFAVRWEKPDGQSLPDIAEVSLLIGPSFSYKEKTDPQTGLRVKVTTEPILGPMGLANLDAGSMSLTYAPDRLKKLLQTGRVKVLPILNQQSGAIERYQITPYNSQGQALPSTYQNANLNQEAAIHVRDPDTGESLSATLMPYAVYFAPRAEGFLESRTWGKVKPYGTAIHGADLAHISPRNMENLGSAGCARVQNHFGHNTFQAIQKHLAKNGAQFLNGGSVAEVYERDLKNGGSLSGQSLVDNPQNAANLAAFLKSREKISIQGYMAATPTQMLQYYHSALTAQWKVVLSKPVNPTDVGPLGPEYANALNARATYSQVTNQWNAIYQQAKSDYESSGNWGRDRKYQRLQQVTQQRDQALNQAYLAADQSAKVLMASLEKLDSTRRSTLPKDFQKLMAIRKKIQEYQPAALDPQKAHQPLAKMDDETYQFYANRMNRSKLYSKTAEAMERYYSDTYGQRIPQACMATVQLYRQRAIEFAQGLPPRAEPVE